VSVLKLVCLSMMANPTNTITTRMMREIVNLKAAEKNLLHMPGLLGLKKIKTNVQCKPNPKNDALPPKLKNLVKPGLSRVQARINQPLGFLVVKPGLLGFTICAKRILLVSLVILRTRETRLNKAPEVLM